jgi:hypothetical protein
MRDEDYIELNRGVEQDRLTARGAAILFLVVAAVIFLVARCAPPNITITKDDPVTRNMTER